MPSWIIGRYPFVQLILIALELTAGAALGLNLEDCDRILDHFDEAYVVACRHAVVQEHALK